MDNILTELGIDTSNPNISKQDILHLIETGLKENQPFAKYFAETVLSELQSKFKQIKIETTPIKIDGEALSEDINKRISSGLDKQIDSAVKKTEESIQKTVKNLSKEKPLSISTLLGQTPKMSAYTQMQYNSLSRSIIDRIKKGLPEKIDLGSKDGLQLSSIFAPPNDKTYPMQGIRYAWQWNNLRRSILSKIKPPTEDIFLNKNDLTVSDIFAPPRDKMYPMQGIRYAWQWNNLRRSILSKIKPPTEDIIISKDDLAISDIFTPSQDKLYPLQGALFAWKWNSLKRKILEKIKPPSDDITISKKSLTLSSLFAPPGDNIYPLQGLRLAWRWNTLRRELLEKVKIPQNINISEDSFTLDAIMGSTPKMSLWTRHKWNQLQRDILKKARKSINTTSVDSSENKKTKKDDFVSRPGKDVQEVSKDDTIFGVKNPAKLLQGIFGQKKESKEFKSLEEREPTVKVSGFTREALKDLSSIPGLKSTEKLTDKKEEVDGGIPSWLKMLGMAGVALLGGGIWAVASGFFDTGPFKGLKKLLGTLAMKLGGRFVKSFIDLTTTHFTKLFGGMIDNLVGVFGKIFPKIGDDIVKLGGSIGGKFLTKAAGTVGKMFKPILKKLPLIGTIISFAYAYNRFKTGDVFGGMLDMASGLASLIPGVGTALSIGIDIISAVRDIKTPQEERVKQTGGGIPIFKMAAGLISKFFTKGILKKLPFIGSILNFVEAYNMFKSGNILKGTLSAVAGIAGLFPGAGTMLSIGIDILNGFIKPKDNVEEVTKKEGSSFNLAVWSKSIFKKIINILKETGIYKFGHGIYKLFKGKFSEGFSEMAKVVSGLPIIGPVFSTLNSWISESREQQQFAEASGKPKSIFQAFKDVVYEKIKKGIHNLPWWLKRVMKYIPGLSNIIGQVQEPNEQNGFESTSEISSKQKKKHWYTPWRDEESEEAQDFIWRKGQKVQKFSSADNIIAVKNQNLFDRLLSDKSKPVDLNLDKVVIAVESMHKDFNKSFTQMQNTVSDAISNTRRSQPQIMQADLAGIPDSAGETRDPAYILRSRAWDRIRKGYVVI